MKRVVYITVILLLVVAIFDPANKIANLKVPLFVATWFSFVIFVAVEQRVTVSRSLLLYLSLFVFLFPLLSITIYALRGNSLTQYDGFKYFQSYLFLTLAIILHCTRLDITRPLSIVLTMLSVCIVGTLAVTVVSPDSIPEIYQIGDAYGVFSLGQRAYGGTTFNLVYFVTAPLLVIAVAKYAYLTFVSAGADRVKYLAALIINSGAMFLAGTRNSILFSMLLPLMVFYWYSKKTVVLHGLIAAVAIALVLLNLDVLSDMFSPADISNQIKLGYIKDYGLIFSRPADVIFGQGLGAFFYSSSVNDYVSITELTYLEFVRNFGLVVAVLYYGLLLYPLSGLRKITHEGDHWLYLAYIAYLVMSFSNPMIVHSSGMLVLAVILQKTFKVRTISASPAKASDPSVLRV